MIFISKLKLKKKTNQTPSFIHENARSLSNIRDIEKAKLYAVRFYQAHSFPKTTKNLEHTILSKFWNKLNPFLDKKTVLRARIRLEFAPCMKQDARFGIIMDAKTAIDWLYAVYFLIVLYADGSMHKTSSKNWHSYYLQDIHRYILTTPSLVQE